MAKKNKNKLVANVNIGTKRIKKEAKLFEIANKLVTAYSKSFSPDTLKRANIKGSKKAPNKTRALMFATIVNTIANKQGDKLTDIYETNTTNSIVGLTIYNLCNGSKAESLTVEGL